MKITKHGYDRFVERLGDIPYKDRREMITSAYLYGKKVYDVDGIIKLKYNHFTFVFDKKSKTLLTVY